jgi:CheY-like chemotaxis protein
VDLVRLIGDVRDIVRTITAEKRIRLVCEVDPSVAKIVIDPAKLKQVLYNFLSNALKFTREDGSVTVRVLPEGTDRFRLEVEDTGIGIRNEDFGLLFVEFQQLDATAAKKFQGTGLGLALTRRLVEAQGGQVGVTSTFGRGSTFFAILPRVAKRLEAPLPVETGAAILVVEDDAKDRSWLVSTLSAAGYTVEAVATGQAAIAAARTRVFDCVTLDLLLPDMSGWEVLRGIRETSLNPDLPAIVVTVMADEGSGIGFGIQEFLVKPVSPSDLVSALDRIRLPAGSQRSLLIIDDDATASKRMESALITVDYQMTSMLDGESGLAAAREHPPSAIVLDLMMPGMDGFEFLHRFRLTPRGRRTPVIVWSAKDLSRPERARLQASANAIIHKGAGSADLLLAEVQRCVPSPRGTHAE